MRRSLLLLPLLAFPAEAVEIGLRMGDHPAYGRVVFDLPAADHAATVENDGRAIRIRFAADDTIAPAPRRVPRNVTSISVEGTEAVVALRAGARPRHYRLGNRLVLDVLDPAAPPPAAPAAEPRPATVQTPPDAAAPSEPRRGGRAASTQAVQRAPAPDRRRPTLDAPAAAGLRDLSRATAVPVDPERPPANPDAPPPAPGQGRVPAVDVAAVLPVAAGLRAIRTGDGPGLLLPAPTGTGLAILRRGDAILVVIDAPIPLDPVTLRSDPVFAATDVTTSPEATVLRIRLAAPAVLRARRDAEGWAVIASHSQAAGRTILATPDGTSVLLHAPSPGRAVPVTDPETGLPLILGTLVEGGASVPASIRAPQADILPTMLGVAVLARGDAPSLRAGNERFTLVGVRLPAASGAEALLTRQFDFPRLDPAAASQRLRTLQTSIAEAPPLGRLGLRRDAAETLMSMGLGQEAQAMLRLAFAEDPRASADPRVTALHAAAALLAGRHDDAAPLLAGAASDEAALWSGLARGTRENSGAAAIAATLPLLLSYPEPLRARLLPMAAEALVGGSERAAARRLLDAQRDDPSLDLARAQLAAAEGRGDEALRVYDGLAEGRDRLLRARAIRAAVELRLASGAIEAATAAATLEAALYAWRGDAREADTRLRLAELRRMAGDPRAALTLLSETAGLFPEHAEAVRRGQQEALIALLGREAPLAAVALAEAHADLLPRDARGTDALLNLAERLAALDLPARAVTMARRGLDRADPTSRPAAGAALAGHLLAANDAAGAVFALSATDAPDLPAELLVRRRLLQARAMAATGDAAVAIATLRDLGAAGRAPLATLLAERGDWPAAADITAEAAEDPGADLPRLAVRAAAYAALAGDASRSAAYRARWLPRIGDGPLAAAFDLLTSDPVRGLAGLRSLPRELDLFRTIPQGLEAFRTAATVSR